jgi:hypothetical protein
MKKYGNKLFLGVAWVTLIAALFSILMVTYWMVRPYTGLYNVPQPFPVNPAVAQVGHLVSYTVSYCIDETLPLPLTVTREMELQGPNGMLFPLSPTIGYMITQRCETRTLAFGIATYVPPGTYHVHYNTDLRVNPFRDIHQQFVSQNFVIVPDKTAAEAAKVVKDTATQTAKDLKKK